MMNQVLIVGRLVANPEIVEKENKKETEITLAVNRSYKNADGIYETDFIDCILWSGIAENTVEYCKKGDVIGVRGRLETKNIEDENGKKIKVTQIIADKVTFLASKRSESGDDLSA